MTKRIVVTGIGATSALGGTAPENWANLLAGVSGTHTLTHEWIETYQIPVKFAAEASVRPEEVLPRHEAKRLDPSVQFALIVALSASNNFVTQSNPVMSMIIGPGGYRPAELWKLGVPLSMIYTAIVVLMVNLLF